MKKLSFFRVFCKLTLSTLLCGQIAAQSVTHADLSADKLVPITLKFDNGGSITFKPIPLGAMPFKMGSPKSEVERADVKEDQVDVTLTKSYWMAETEVTQAQWESVMGTSLKQHKDKHSPQGEMVGEGPDQPMCYVNYDDAVAFCKKLNTLFAKQLPAGTKVRLPTEAQWEYASRGGDTTRVFGVGDGTNLRKKNANFDWSRPYGKAVKSAASTGPVAVKSYPADKTYGLFDMHGNVWEWCLDLWDGESKLIGGIDPISKVGSQRVLRGGAWTYEGWSCRSAIRVRDRPSVRTADCGFRPAIVSQLLK